VMVHHSLRRAIFGEMRRTRRRRMKGKYPARLAGNRSDGLSDVEAGEHIGWRLGLEDLIERTS